MSGETSLSTIITPSKTASLEEISSGSTYSQSTSEYDSSSPKMIAKKYVNRPRRTTKERQVLLAGPDSTTEVSSSRVDSSLIGATANERSDSVDIDADDEDDPSLDAAENERMNLLQRRRRIKQDDHVITWKGSTRIKAGTSFQLPFVLDQRAPNAILVWEFTTVGGDIDFDVEARNASISIDDSCGYSRDTQFRAHHVKKIVLRERHQSHQLRAGSKIHIVYSLGQLERAASLEHALAVSALAKRSSPWRITPGGMRGVLGRMNRASQAAGKRRPNASGGSADPRNQPKGPGRVQPPRIQWRGEKDISAGGRPVELVGPSTIVMCWSNEHSFWTDKLLNYTVRLDMRPWWREKASIALQAVVRGAQVRHKGKAHHVRRLYETKTPAKTQKHATQQRHQFREQCTSQLRFCTPGRYEQITGKKVEEKGKEDDDNLPKIVRF
jgi:hypothetical protein